MPVRPGSCGRAGPGSVIELMDDQLQPIPGEGEGLLCVRRDIHPGIMKHYWNKPQQTDDVFRGPWYVTGDVLRRDEAGYFWFQGRSDDLIKTSGYLVSPFEVESCLCRHPEVQEAAAIAVRDELRGHVIKGLVVVRGGNIGDPLLSERIRDFCRSQIAPYKCPRQIEVVESLPKTVSGKSNAESYGQKTENLMDTAANLDRPSPECREPLRGWLLAVVQQGGSDLHVVAGYPPVVRLHGELLELESRPVEADQVRALLVALCPAHALEHFQSDCNVDFAMELELPDGRQRYRANYFLSGQQMGACFRVIPSAIPSFHWAGFPEELARRLAHFRNGLILISGVAGSGKTTTLAMVINLLVREGSYRIVTVEEPVEYLFPRVSGSIVTQREVGLDVHTFADGLKYALRQDPDVILAGEIRDRETAQMALSAAETGHLVFSTLHTRDAKGAISRFADLFPQDAQREIRSQLSLSLRAVISQHLLPSAVRGEKRILALEILFNNAPIASAIRFGKIESIDNNILTGALKEC